MFECIFSTVQTYTVVKFRLGGLFMDYKKEIIELLDKVKLESTLKRVYKLLVYLYLREK